MRRRPVPAARPRLPPLRRAARPRPRLLRVPSPASAPARPAARSLLRQRRPRAVTPVLPKPITIGQLGTVESKAVATTGFGRTNGDQALTITVSKASNANTVEVADAVQAKLAEIGQRHADQLTITTVADQSVFIKELANGLLREGGLGAVFAILTIFLFLFSLRATVVAAVSIPLSILAALVIMQLTGVTINIMTLGGLAVAVGRVVDDAIVVLENIYRHRALGEDRFTASVNGPREVAGAITASTLTTVAVFLPLGFVGGLVSQFFLPFALTVTFALLASLVCALTVVPVLGYFLIRDVRAGVDENGEPTRSIWVRMYTPLIQFALRGRATKIGIVAGATVLFIASAALAPLLPTQFINAGSEKTLIVTVAPPTGATSAGVLAKTIETEKVILADPAVELVQTSIPAEGDTSSQVLQSAFLGRPANSATMTVRLKSDADLDATSARLTTALQPVATDGYAATVSSGFGFSSGGLNVTVTGESAADVDKATVAIVGALKDQPDITNLKSDLVKATPEVQVTVDPNKAISVGMTAAQVAAQVRAALVAQPATSVQSADGQTVQVIVQLDPAAVTSVDALKALPVGTVAVAPLGTIAKVEQVAVQGSISRIDQRPASSVTADITGDDTGAVSKSVQKELDTLSAAGAFPAGTTAELAGVSQQQSQAFGGLFASMGVAILLVYVMMVLTFNSLVTPFVILFTPAAGDDRRLRCPVRHGPSDRRQRAHRLPDAHRDRRDERDRHARPRRTPARRGPLDPRRPRRGRTDPRPADPHDGDRDDPRPDPARRGLQPGLDHRGRARHGRHRRAVQLDVPDAARDPGRLFAGRRSPVTVRAAPRRRAGRDCRAGAGRLNSGPRAGGRRHNERRHAATSRGERAPRVRDKLVVTRAFGEDFLSIRRM